MEEGVVYGVAYDLLITVFGASDWLPFPCFFSLYHITDGFRSMSLQVPNIVDFSASCDERRGNEEAVASCV